nr:MULTISPECIES: hypothetical protein [unclassified Bradyrhizobium]
MLNSVAILLRISVFEYHRTCSSISPITPPILSFCSAWCATLLLRSTIATSRSSVSSPSSNSCSECGSTAAPSAPIPDQLALGLEDLDSDIGRVEEAQPQVTPEPAAADAVEPDADRPQRVPDRVPKIEKFVLEIAAMRQQQPSPIAHRDSM